MRCVCGKCVFDQSPNPNFDITPTLTIILAIIQTVTQTLAKMVASVSSFILYIHYSRCYMLYQSLMMIQADARYLGPWGDPNVPKKLLLVRPGLIQNSIDVMRRGNGFSLPTGDWVWEDRAALSQIFFCFKH